MAEGMRKGVQALRSKASRQTINYRLARDGGMGIGGDAGRFNWIIARPTPHTEEMLCPAVMPREVSMPPCRSWLTA